MTAYILRRPLADGAHSRGEVILLVFLLFKFFGGDPSQILAGQGGEPGADRRHRRELGLDQPWYAQLGIFVREIISFDFGKTGMTREQVSSYILPHSATSDADIRSRSCCSKADVCHSDRHAGRTYVPRHAARPPR